MDNKTLIALVTVITVLANLGFALTGITHTVSCTVSSLTSAAYAAFIEER
jgi:hypothetical protein